MMFFFFFKPKTAYEMRISDCSSDVCSSDLDIDHFKNFNDRWGHALGDEVLRLVAQSMEHFFHGPGFAARYGGEEFVIVLPGKDLEAAGDIAEQFRDFIGSRTIRYKQSNEDDGKNTLSLGGSPLRRDEIGKA